MRGFSLALGGALIFIASLSVEAGSVTLFDNSPESNGKLTLSQTKISVDGGAVPEVNLSDVLEADFADAPFHLDYFSSDKNPDQLPPDWKSENIGPNDAAGTFSYAKGIFTLNSGTHEITNWGDATEHTLFLGCPWNGNGRWSLHLREITGNDNSMAGIVLRENLDAAKGGLYRIATRNQNGGSIFMRQSGGGYYGQSPDIDIPIWLRVTRSGLDLAVAEARDGLNWSTLNQTLAPLATGTMVGMYLDNAPKPPAIAKFDHLLFEPAPSLSDVLPTGVLLCDGTYLAGTFAYYEISAPDSPGTFLRQGKELSIPANKIAAVLLNPTERQRIKKFSAQTGILMKNEDFIQGDIQAILPGDPDTIRVNSLLLGITDIGERFGSNPVEAAFLHAVQPQASDYEVRLTDGSIIRATGVSANNGGLIITDAAGLAISIDANEVAQFRAGSSRVQSLLDLGWKTPGVAATPTAPPAASNPGAPIPPPADVPALPLPPVECWEGNEQQQIMVASSGVQIDFSLASGFRAVALRVALSPDSPPNAEATLRLLAEGHEIARTPALKAGDAPRFIEVTLPALKTLTLEADSTITGTRLLFIDPVAIRDHPNGSGVTPVP